MATNNNYSQKIIKIESKHLNETLYLPVFGDYGFILLTFPCLSDQFDENVDMKFVEAVSEKVSNGMFRFVFVPTIGNRIWKDFQKDAQTRSALFLSYNLFLIDEVLPTIYKLAGNPMPIITFGCGDAGFFASNSFFRRPDLFYGTISIDGFFDIRKLYCDDLNSKYFFDDNCYFNSPLDFLPQLTEDYWLIHLRGKKHIYLYACEENEHQDANESHFNPKNQVELLSDILAGKNIFSFKKGFFKSEGKSKWECWVQIFRSIVTENF
ncbi:MAG: hypothetical protein N2517_03020 [Ignavibacteria bacterium]|nr:hypothetical protein [Ignavibacteria bacterium]